MNHRDRETKLEIMGLDDFVASREYRFALGLPSERTEVYVPLAHGEYNMNYTFIHPVTGERLVLRVNSESQAGLEDQIGYEANALRILAPTGRTPILRYVDQSDRYLEHGALVMSFVPGRTLSYDSARERRAVAECLADIHSLRVSPENGAPCISEEASSCVAKSGLIAPADPWRAMLDECEGMFSVYCGSPQRDRSVERRLRALLDEGRRRVADRGAHRGYCCCINTELNNTNFLIAEKTSDEAAGAAPFAYLVDWEKPLYGDPAQDLGHFLTPTTTFWKTDVIFDDRTIETFIDDYIEAVCRRYDTAGLRERTHEFIVITCLRGLTWCAMAWVRYQSGDKIIMNESTRVKLNAYLGDSFLTRIEELFGMRKS